MRSERAPSIIRKLYKLPFDCYFKYRQKQFSRNKLLSLHMKMCYKYNLSLEEGLIRFIRAWVLNKSNGVDSTCFVVNLPSNLYLDTQFALEWQWLGYLPHQTVDCTWPFRCRTKLYLKTNQRQIFECLSLFEVYL